MSEKPDFKVGDAFKAIFTKLIERITVQVFLFALAAMALLVLVAYLAGFPKEFILPVIGGILLIFLVAVVAWAYVELKKGQTQVKSVQEHLPNPVGPQTIIDLLKTTEDFLPPGTKFRSNIMAPEENSIIMKYHYNYAPTDREPEIVLERGEGCTGQALIHNKQVFAKIGQPLWFLREENHRLLNPNLTWVFSTPIARRKDGRAESFAAYNIDLLQDADEKLVADLLPKAVNHARILGAILPSPL